MIDLGMQTLFVFVCSGKIFFQQFQISFLKERAQREEI